MKFKNLTSAALAALVFLSWAACTKPTPFGSDLLSEELADYDYAELPVRFTVEREDSLVTSDRTFTAAYFLCGKLNDPLFGQSESELFTLCKLRTLSPDFDSTTLDSIVLFLGYSASAVYGDTTQLQTLKVHRLVTPISSTKTYYSTDDLTEGEEIGSIENFLPRPRTTKILFDSVEAGGAQVKAPHLRIRLNDAFGQEILAMDSAALSKDSLFWVQLRGLSITAGSASAPGAMLAFNLNSETYSRIRLYYRQGEAQTKKTFDLNFTNANKFVHYTHDYGTSVAGQQINQVSDQLLYLQGMTGLRLRMELPTIDTFQNIAVNRAELQLTAATVPGDDPILAANPANQLGFTELQGDSLFVFTSDVAYSLNATGNSFQLFGGFPNTITENSETIKRYTLTLSQRLQNMVDDTSSDIKNKTLYVNVYPQRSSAQRGVFYGPGSAKFPAKVIMKYTRIPK